MIRSKTKCKRVLKEKRNIGAPQRKKFKGENDSAPTKQATARPAQNSVEMKPEPQNTQKGKGTSCKYGECRVDFNHQSELYDHLLAVHLPEAMAILKEENEVKCLFEKCTSWPFKIWRSITAETIEQRLKSHFLTFHAPQAKLFKCGECNFRGGTAQALNSHYTVEHVQKKKEIPKEEPKEIPVRIPVRPVERYVETKETKEERARKRAVLKQFFKKVEDPNLRIETVRREGTGAARRKNCKSGGIRFVPRTPETEERMEENEVPPTVEDETNRKEQNTKPPPPLDLSYLNLTFKDLFPTPEKIPPKNVPKKKKKVKKLLNTHDAMEDKKQTIGVEANQALMMDKMYAVKRNPKTRSLPF